MGRNRPGIRAGKGPSKRKRGRRGRRPFIYVKIARQRISYLNRLADEMAACGRLDLAGRYLQLARKVGMKYNQRLPRGFRLKYCKHCRAYLMSGKNAVVRLKKGTLEVRCLRCGRVRRKPYLKEKMKEIIEK